MSVLINLLPDLRQAKAKAHQRRRLFSGIALFIWIACAVVLVLLTLSLASQKLIISSNNGTISDNETQLRNMPGLTDAITAQQHLDSLGTLYNQRVYLSHFFHALSQTTPQTITVNALSLDSSNELNITGSGTDFTSVAKLSRALQAENVTIGDNPSASNEPYFTDVTIQSVDNSNGTVGFTINATMSAGATNGQ